MKNIVLFIVIFISQTTFAQDIFRATIKDGETKESLIGATATLKGTGNGSSSGRNGEVEIKNIPNGQQTIVFSYIGYENLEKSFAFPLADSLQNRVIFLNPETEKVEEVVVTTARTNSRIEEQPMRVEVLGNDEVNEEVNINPSNIGKMLSESMGVQPLQTSAVNGNVSIRLQGLDGKYTQILKDGLPLYSGFAGGLSVMQIPPLDLKQVEIIKGPSSVLYGSGAIAGIVNLVSKQPVEKKELTLMANQTSLLGTNLNGYYSSGLGSGKKFGLTFLTNNSFQEYKDVSHNGFSDLPEIKTFYLSPTFYYYFNQKTTLRFGLTTTFDKRIGGDMSVLAGKADALHRYFEEDISKRASSQFEFKEEFRNNDMLTIKNSVSYFNRTINQSTTSFQGSQTSNYSEASFNFSAGKHQFVTGINLVTEKFSEDTTKSHLDRDYNYYTAGLFLQDQYRPVRKLLLMAGLRIDFQNKFGSFVLPHLAMMYHFTDDFYMRAGGGPGYEVPTIFSSVAEEKGINSVMPFSSDVKPEKSIGGDLDFNYKKIIDGESSISVNQSFFVTHISNPLVLDSVSFVNKDRPVITKGFETSVHLVLDELDVFAGYTFVDAEQRYDVASPFVPLTPKNKITTDIVYEKEGNWKTGIEGDYLSSMYRDSDSKTKLYFIVGLMAQKQFGKLTFIASLENLLDVRQTRFENIVIPPQSDPTFRQIYAPLDGRVFNAAVKFSIK